MKILITGANGQLGSALQEALLGHVLVCRDLDLDITDADALASFLSAEQPELVLNAAAFTNVDGAEADPEGARLGNEVGPKTLAQATAALEIPLMHFSTDYVFDGEAGRAYLESDAPNPRTVYGRTKLAGEQAVQAANPAHWIVRTAWLYHTIGRNFALTMLGLADSGQVRVVDDQTGSPTFAPHLARGVAELIQQREYGIHHLAGAGETSWYGLTCALYKELGLAVDVQPCTTDEFPRPAARPRFSALGSERTLRLPAWEQGVEDFAARYREEHS